MIGKKTWVVAVVSAGLAAGTMQMVHASSGPAAQRMDDDSYPKMRQALRDLRQAKDSLDKAEPHFEGHRAKAIEDVNHAIKECEDALSEG